MTGKWRGSSPIPGGTWKGTKMVFAGLRKDADIEAVIAYIRSEGG